MDMMRKEMAKAVCFGAIGLFASAALAATIEAGRITVDAGEAAYSLTETDVTTLGNGAVEKIGGGTVTMKLNVNFKELKVSEGTFELAANFSRGLTKLEIAEGATFRVKKSIEVTTNQSIVNNGTIDIAVGTLSFSYGAELSGTGKVIVDGNAGKTYTAVAMKYLRNPVPWRLEKNTAYGVSSGAFQINQQSANAVTENCWNGDMVLNADLVLYSSPHCVLKAGGRVSGSAGFTTTQAYLLLQNDDNDFEGKVTLNTSSSGAEAGVIGDSAAAMRGITTNSSAHVDGIKLYTDTASSGNGYWGWKMYDGKRRALVGARFGSGRWTQADYFEFLDTYPMTAALYTLPGETATNSWDFTGKWIVNAGHGTNVFRGTAGAKTRLVNWGGTVKIPDGEQTLDYVMLQDGTLEIAENAKVHAFTNIYIGGSWPLTPRLVVKDGAVLDNPDNRAELQMDWNWVDFKKEYQGWNGSPSSLYPCVRGIVDIIGGAVTNCLNCQCYSKNQPSAACYVRGGELYCPNPATSSMRWAQNGNGYLGVESGKFTANTPVVIGETGYGTVVQTGGEMLFKTYLRLGLCGGFATVYWNGGEMKLDSKLQFCCKNGTTVATSGRSVLTADNPNGTLEIADNIEVGGDTNTTAIMNFNAGVVEAANIWTRLHGEGETAVLYNFNGGTLKFRKYGFSSNETENDRITVFGGGATIDVAADKSGYTYSPITRPTGKGVAAIAIPKAASTPWNYIGSPEITIEGDGKGATAVALFDAEAGIVTNVVITSAGNDYTQATAKWSYSGWTNLETTVVTLADNGKGGNFTKVGAGALYITRPAVFDGEIRMREGTVKAQNADKQCTFTEANDLVFEGGTLIIENGYTAKSVKIAGNGTFGAPNNKLTVSEALKLDVANAGTLTVNGAFELGSDASIELTDDAGATGFASAIVLSATGGITGVAQDTIIEGTSNRWHLMLSADKKSLKCRRSSGFVISVR